MNKKEAKEKFQEILNKQEIENLESNNNRARSITVGTAFGGTTEIMMRSDGGKHIWCIMQPVEVVELIHQLAANVGCHIALKPRNDFSSWRDWKLTEEEKLHYNGHPPFVNDMAPFNQLGALIEKNKEALQDILNGSPNVAMDENNVVVNKAILKNGNVHMFGGAGGGSVQKLEEIERIKNGKVMAAKKSKNQSSSK